MIKIHRHTLLFGGFLLATLTVYGQGDGPTEALTLEACQQLARANYPQIRKLGLIEESSAYSLANASMVFLPKLSINGQASYQSETVNFANALGGALRSEEHTSELQSLMRISYAVFCLKKKH